MIDVHFHPFEDELDPDLGAVLQRARQAGVVAAIGAGVDQPTSLRCVRLAARHDGLYAAVGWHPWFLRPADLPGFEEVGLEPIRQLAADERVVAIGEIGLDGKVAVPMSLQQRAFVQQLELARSLSLPVIIHSRKAVQRTYDLLGDFAGQPMLLHSFSGSVEMADRFLALGCCFSFSGSVTRKNALRVHALATHLPLERLLLETDAPAIGLDGVVAARVEPRHVARVAGAIARLRGVEPAQVEHITTQNAIWLFDLPLAVGP